MFGNLNTYRSFLQSFLLLSYLLSIFQTPAFELAHFLSHVCQISPTHAELHSYGIDHVHDHNHRVLALLDNSTSESEDHPTNTPDLELKKKAEINTPLLAASMISLPYHSNNFGNLKKPTKLYQQLVVPPPQFFHVRFL